MQLIWKRKALQIKAVVGDAILLLLVSSQLLSCSTRKFTEVNYFVKPQIDSNVMVYFCLDSSEVKKDHISTIIPAQFIGGEDSLYRFIEMNKQTVDESIETLLDELTVSVYFDIEKSGCPTNFRVSDSIEIYYPKHTSESLRIAKLLPCWVPASDIDGTGRRVLIRDTWRSIDVTFKNMNYEKK